MRIQPAAHPRFYLFLLLAPLALAPSRLAGEDHTPILCAAPPAEARLDALAPCIQRRQVRLVLLDGRILKGKMILPEGDSCGPGQNCTIRIRSRFRRRQVQPEEISIVEYRPRHSRKRRLAAVLAGAAAGAGATKWLLSQGAGEGIGAVTLVFGAKAGVAGGAITYHAIRPEPVVVRITRP